MFRHAIDIKGYRLALTDAELGKVKDFYFDDSLWIVRYLVADTSGLLPGRQVLISPVSLNQVDEKQKKISINLSKEDVEFSPPIDLDKPVSRQDEKKIVNYYTWPNYWEAKAHEVSEKKDPNLRSMQEIKNYEICGTDGPVGYVKDFIIDDLDWSVSYMVVDTRKLIPGRKVLLALRWIREIDAEEKKVVVDVACDAVRSAPEYNPETPLNREIEAGIFDHYEKEYY